MSYLVKRCLKCKAANDPAMSYCAKCGTTLPTQRAESDTPPLAVPAYAAPPVKDDAPIPPRGPIECVIKDVEVPFWSMVTLMVKLAIASVPALLFLIILGISGIILLSAIGVMVKPY